MAADAGERERGLMTEVVMSAVMIDGEVRAVCNGCTALLESAGVLRRVGERPINPHQPQFIFALFEIVPPHTLADCQARIASRHVGLAWGEAPPPLTVF
jgi:hypothetical protein